MALNFAQFAKTAAAAQPEAAKERKTAQVWMNIGITVPMPREDGTTEDVFVSVPFGLAIDTMEDVAIRGGKDWQFMAQAKNWLLAELKKAGEALEPGQVTSIEGLEIQLRRVGAAAAPAEGDNPLLAAMSDRFKAAS